MEESKEKKVNPEEEKALADLYFDVFGEESKEYMVKDIEQIVASISKNSMMNRIRFLVSDPDFTHPAIKAGKNNTYLMMYSALKTLQLF